MKSELPPAPGQTRSELRVRYVHTTLMSKEGPLFSLDDIAPDYDP
jgi:hypothetical protein